MAAVRSETWWRVLLVAGAIGMFLSGLVGFLNAAVVDGERFAELVNEVRQDEDVRAEVGRAIATAAVDAQPDLVAIEPAIAAGAGAVVGSSVLDGVFTSSVEEFHGALTQEGGSNAVLTLADLGATVTAALERFVPQAAEVIPDDLSLTLAQVGGQGGVAAQIIPVINAVSVLAWVLPLVSIALIALGIWLAPGHRVAVVQLGWMLVVVGGLLGLLVIAMALASALADNTTVTGAVAGAALSSFSQPLAVRFVATVVVGGLLVVAGGALLPQVDVRRHLGDAWAFASRRPTNPVWAVVRSLVVILLGTLVVLFPSASAQVVAVLAGLVVLVVGITELDAVAERSRAAHDRARGADGPQEEPADLDRPGRAGVWLIPAAAGAAGALVLGLLLVPDHLPQDDRVQTVAVSSEACNGYVELCDRPFDQVVIPASHNSMSVADGQWFLAEQPTDMVESLDDGIRGLLVDTWYGRATASGGAITAARSLAEAEAELRATYGDEVAASVQRTVDRVRGEEAVGPVEPYFCHTVCEIGATRVLPVMQRLRTWMDTHPRDVVVLFIQDVVTPEDTAAVLQEAGLAELAYTHAVGQPWPTLRQMIEANTRLLVLMENEGGGERFPWLHQGFDLVQDTEYTFSSAEDFTCTLKRGRPDSPLLSVNHWLASFTTLVSSAEQVNAYDVLTERVEECREVRGRTPSMIAVNWYDRGDLFRVVNELNGVG